MNDRTKMAEYMQELREQVCSHCIERPAGGPPCAPRGKQCGLELHLPKLVELVHTVHAEAIDPYIDRFHEDICTTCPSRNTEHCPCALEYLLTLAVQAIETVDERRDRTVDRQRKSLSQ